MVPSMARDFQSLIVFGRMDNHSIEEILKENKLYPLQLNILGKTHAIGALSFFNYRDSDMGSFQEIYLVVVATKKKMKTISSISSILKAVRPSRQSEETDLVLFHLKAYSSSEMGVLGSREVWKIDSDLANIQTKQSDNWLQFSMEGKVSSFDINSFTKLPINSNFNLDASGPAMEGTQAFSHVLSCSQAAYSVFNSKRHLISVDPGLESLIQQFAFRPWFVEYSPHSKAIQFSPR